MTNKGIQMTSIVHKVPSKGKERYFLCLENQDHPSNAVGIFLRKIGYNVSQRTEESLVEIQDLMSHASAHRSTIYITASQRQHDIEPRTALEGSIYVPPEYMVRDVVPEAAWDCENRILLGKIPCSGGIRALKVRVSEYGLCFTVALVFQPLGIVVFDCDRSPRISSQLFTRTHRRSFLNWNELLSKIPVLRNFSEELEIAQFNIHVRTEALAHVLPLRQLHIGVARKSMHLSNLTALFSETTNDVLFPDSFGIIG
ncbi:hypothetical protein RRF57_005880 [Xylaria bambusicola]|uniref:Uncharacterized protein n=1 Tax=Xylaria bambusicola TaxID=326684 RepID=A0AAN7UDD1_9PEZI